MSGAYYNEIDPYAAQWLRNLIAAGHIAPGDVDERSIADVRADDIRGYVQCHFFAGIGVWSHALRSAGWADDRPVWTGSCPCQPFSAAGKGDEFGDERHLWPVWFGLIRECRPESVFGEQVASKDALAWLDHVSTDLEGEGYTFGAVDTCAAGFGAPHIRQRFYFVAYNVGAVQQGFIRPSDVELQGTSGTSRPASESGLPSWVANAKDSVWRRADFAQHGGRGIEEIGGPGPVGGRWGDAEWVDCVDGKRRPHGPESFPLSLVDGTPGRVGRLRAYGNAINAAQAEEFIRAYQEARP